jgi:Protein of unknown function (DUF2026)
MPKDTKPLIPFPDYCRIFRVIYTVLDERAKTHSACIFFAMAGAALLRKYYKFDAVAVCGAAVYAVGSDDGVVATFGKVENNELTATADAFHCWVECKSYVIDFMSPIFQENLHEHGCLTTVPRRGFQKPLAAMSPTLPHNFHEGVFHLVGSRERTEAMIKTFGEEPASGDLVNLCLHWYRRPPRRIDSTFDIEDDLGNIALLKLHGPDVAGFW